jgi:hypothetical protein
MSKKNLFLKLNINKNPTFSSDNKNNNENTKNNAMLMFERLLNNKKKFTLDNHFDKRNSHKFLLEKEKYLSPIELDDGDLLNESLEKNKSREEILIPNGAPNRYTFGQK